MTVRILKFDGITIHVYPDSTLIEYEDGSLVPGTPEDTDEYRATAERYGYGDDTTRLCIDHEIMHVALSQWLGLADSPTMQSVRTGDPGDRQIRDHEEAAVLAVQQFARMVGVDVVELFAAVLEE